MEAVKSMYKLFAGYNYYPNGGYNDFKGSFSSIEEARKKARQGIPYEDGSGISYYNWYQIVCQDIIVIAAERNNYRNYKDYEWIENNEE